VHLLADLEFPPIGELVVWKDIFGGINKVALIGFAAALIPMILFFVAGRKRALVPTGVQNVAETLVDFIHDGIILQTIGPDGMNGPYPAFLLSLFSFILFCNIFEVVPFIQFPTTARMAIPATLALLVWVIFNYVGIKHHGFFGYFKALLFPPGVPFALYFLVTPILFVSDIIVRPFSLAVRLFANMLAGHLLLVTFAVLTQALLVKSWQIVILPLPFAMEIAITGFEVLVAVLQAFIFTILTAVYIGGSLHPEH
jgi:F-type H+-transporting ATPase subunit a